MKKLFFLLLTLAVLTVFVSAQDTGDTDVGGGTQEFVLASALFGHGAEIRVVKPDTVSDVSLSAERIVEIYEKPDREDDGVSVVTVQRNQRRNPFNKEALSFRGS